MKRITVSLLVLILSLSCLVRAAESPAFTPTAVLSEDGTTITVTVSLTGGNQVCGAKFDFAYDPTLVSCQSVAEGSALSGYTFLGNAEYDSGVARATWMGLNPMPADGAVAVITFKVLSPAAGQTALFTITEASAYNELGSSIPVTAGTADVTLPAAPGTNPPGTLPTAPSTTPTTPPAADKEKDPEVFLMAFTDVAQNAYYYDAVQWAVAQGIPPALLTPPSLTTPPATAPRR